MCLCISMCMNRCISECIHVCVLMLHSTKSLLYKILRERRESESNLGTSHNKRQDHQDSRKSKQGLETPRITNQSLK